MFFSIFLSILATCHIFYVFYTTIKDFSMSNIMNVCWDFQGFVSIVRVWWSRLSFQSNFQCLIIRWQFGPFQFIFDGNTWAKLGYPIQIKRRLILIYLLFSLFAGFNVISLVYKIVFYYLKSIGHRNVRINIL